MRPALVRGVDIARLGESEGHPSFRQRVEESFEIVTF